MKPFLLILALLALGLFSLHAQGTPGVPGAKSAEGGQQEGQSEQKPKNARSLNDVDLTKIVGGATMPLNLVIAATIIVNFLAMKYQNAYAQFSQLLNEYRGKQDNEPDIKDKLRHHFARLRAIRRASRLVVGAIITFIATVFVTMIGTLFPEEGVFKALILFGTTIGFILLVLGLIGELIETRLAHLGLQDDVEKLPEVFGGGASAP